MIRIGTLGLGPLIIALGLSAGCAKTTTPRTGSSESHFLVSCDSACGEGLDCVCGACTVPCTKNESCQDLAEDATCIAAVETLSCASETPRSSGPTPGHCDVGCTLDADCRGLGDDFFCTQGACRVANVQMERPQNQRDATVPDTCVGHTDCGEGWVCGYAIVEGCDAVGKCLRVGQEGEVTVTEAPGLLTPGVTACPCDGWEGGDYVRAIATTPSGSDGGSRFTHSDVPVSGQGVGPFACQEAGLCSAPPTCDNDRNNRLQARLTPGEQGLRRFVAVSEYGGHVLGERDGDFAQPHEVVTLEPNNMHVGQSLAVTSAPAPLILADISANEDRFAVLQCSNTECRVSASNTGGGRPQLAFQVSDLGEDAIYGIKATRDGTECERRYEFCVYGSGLHCYGLGEWVTEIEPTSGRRLRDVAIDRAAAACGPSVVVGDAGLVLVRGKEGWAAVDVGVTDDLLAATIAQGHLSIGSATGALLELNNGAAEACGGFDVAVRSLIRLVDKRDSCSEVPPGPARVGLTTRAYGLTVDGRVVGTGSSCVMPEAWSCGPTHPDALDLGVVTCGDEQLPVIVTPDLVFGPRDCPFPP